MTKCNMTLNYMHMGQSGSLMGLTPGVIGKFGLEDGMKQGKD